jgi:hypothetical protein
MQFQRFYFVGSAIASYQYQSNSLSDRRKDDVSQYHKHKADKRVVEAPDGSLYCYLVSSKWINLWKKFANGETS